MSKGFSLCEFNTKKAIKYHHNFGNFDFLLLQANDGTREIDFYCSTPISKEVKTAIGLSAIRQLEQTAATLGYRTTENSPNFHDAVNILSKAVQYIDGRGKLS